MAVTYFCKTNAQISCAAGSSVPGVRCVHHEARAAAAAQATCQPLLTAALPAGHHTHAFTVVQVVKSKQISVANNTYSFASKVFVKTFSNNFASEIILWGKRDWAEKGQDGWEGGKETSHQSLCRPITIQPCNMALPLPATGCELCTEFARPQHQGL